jgi:mono/diheme cytochrome c family protein
MFRGFVVGILLGVVLVLVGVYLYFSTGSAPVAVTAAPIPFERTLAHMSLNAYLKKLPHPDPQVPENEVSYMAGAEVYKQNCAVCHGLPGEPKTNIAEGMAPDPPQLFKGKGVTDDEAWESYWKVENGIRMTGMPGFKGKLTEPQIWQVSVLVKNADKISAVVKAALLSNEPSATPVIPVKPAVVPPTR